MTLCILFSSRLFFFPARLYYCRLENRRTHITPLPANVSIPRSHYFKVIFVGTPPFPIPPRDSKSGLDRCTRVSTYSILSEQMDHRGPRPDERIHSSGGIRTSNPLRACAVKMLKAAGRIELCVWNSQSIDIPERELLALHGAGDGECIIDFISIYALKAAAACLSRS